LILKPLLVVAIVIAAILLYAATRPATFTVQRSISIKAPSDKIYPLISDLRNWPLWAPQDREDSTMHRTFSGAPSGVGAVSDWTSKGSAGSGQMTITTATPEAISIRVDWTRPFHLQNLNSFTLEPSGNSTDVTWTLHGTNIYPLKLMSIFISPDRMMRKHFETGLQNLKTIAER
jgi:uncharacterized protein YndB with AHSA1/START domain